MRSEFNISGMHCAGCAHNIEGSLKKLNGIESAAVNYATESAQIEFDDQIIKEEDIFKAVRGLGYEVKLPQTKDILSCDFQITGMNCASCAKNAQNAINELKGIKSATVNIATETAQVEYDKNQVNLEDIYQAVRDIGYGIKPLTGKIEEEIDEAQLELKQSRQRLITAWIFTGPLVLTMIVFMAMGLHKESILEIILAAPVVFWSGFNTHRRAFLSALHFQANMDTLISLGSLAAYLTGILSFFLPITSFSGVGAMIIGFHLIGKYLESLAKGKSSAAIKQLLTLGAKEATILADGKLKKVPVAQLKIGDIMLIKPGEKIPTDGIIVKGSSRIDESMVTGESRPVKKGEKDEVIGATINQQGSLEVRVSKLGQDTFLAHIIKLVKECQSSKVPIQELVDNVTGYFVPAIILIALFTFISWLVFPSFFINTLQGINKFLPWVNPDLSMISLAVFASIAVLVIACPCALGLATPTAILVGSGLGASNGILIRKGSAIQTMKDIDTLVFDKTGTLTYGKPQIVNIYTQPPYTEQQLLQFAASIEILSEHPLARAVVTHAEAQKIKPLAVKDFSAIAGSGVIAKLAESNGAGKEILAGNSELLKQKGISFDETQFHTWEAKAQSVILIAAGGQFMGGLGISDSLKEDAVPAINELKKMGLKIIMLSGDNKRTAKAIARSAGISEIIAHVLPAEKVKVIEDLQKNGAKVAMVGDGINDAPALSKADVGIAIGTGTDIAIAAADITLIRGDLMGVVRAIKLSRAIFKKIGQNLFWAFFYNIIAIPLAVMGWLHPVIAEIAMAGSSINVIFNSLRLKSTSLD